MYLYMYKFDLLNFDLFTFTIQSITNVKLLSNSNNNHISLHLPSKKSISFCKNTEKIRLNHRSTPSKITKIR
jgi:hypothetical protein